VSLHASLASNVFSKVLVSSLVFFAFILLNVIVISLISTLSASHNSLQFFKSLLILVEYFNIMSFIISGAQIGSREKLVEFGEKNNGYFLG
jgi:hypothetical protein